MERLDPLVRRRVYTALDQLASNDPRVHERKLEALGDWRIRVGDWRIRFIRDTEARTIVVQRVLPRGRAYKR